MKQPEREPERVKMEIRPGLWLDSGLALFLEAERCLVVSDLHWGYAQVHRREGNLFPLWGDAEIGTRLNILLRAYQPSRMIWLGDSLHGPSGFREAEKFLDEVAAEVEVILIGGNHDRGWERPKVDFYQAGGYFFHHGDRSAAVPEDHCEVVGHWHPSISEYDGAGLRLKLPVLVEQPRRLVLPAFSPWSRGTDWKGSAGDVIWIAAGKRIMRKVLPEKR